MLFLLACPSSPRWVRGDTGYRGEEERRETRRKLLERFDPRRRGGHGLGGSTRKDRREGPLSEDILVKIFDEDQKKRTKKGAKKENILDTISNLERISNRSGNEKDEQTKVNENLIRVPLIIKPSRQLRYNIEDIRKITKTILKKFHSKRKSQPGWLKGEASLRQGLIGLDTGSYTIQTWL